eukprot:958368-Amorphochlora_amoeboformis.AAC.1
MSLRSRYHTKVVDDVRDVEELLKLGRPAENATLSKIVITRAHIYTGIGTVVRAKGWKCRVVIRIPVIYMHWCKQGGKRELNVTSKVLKAGKSATL